MRGLFAAGGVAAAVAILSWALVANEAIWRPALIVIGVVVAIYALGMGNFMLFESKIGKVDGRETILDRVNWAGDEQVLDVGCGRGLMLVGAAKRLTTGRAIGVDIWQASDQSANGPDGAIENATLERVAERVEVQTADMRSLPFASDIFDVVTSHWVVHNLERVADRQAALDEMIRVLKPGGTLLLTDIANRDAYRAHLSQRGFGRLQTLVRPVRDKILALISFGSFRPATIIGLKPR